MLACQTMVSSVRSSATFNVTIDELMKINSQMDLKDARINESLTKYSATIKDGQAKKQEMEERMANSECEHQKELNNWKANVNQLNLLHARMCTSHVNVRTESEIEAKKQRALRKSSASPKRGSVAARSRPSGLRRGL